MAELTSPARFFTTSDAAFARWIVSKRKFFILISFSATLLWAILYLDFTVDDAYISFRYGKNLVAHHIWNWNPSPTREEAYTSFTYTVLGIFPALLHLSPALFFKLFGLSTISAILYRVHTVSSSSFASLLALLLVTVNPWVWIHAFSGLETPLYILLILEMAIAVNRASTTPALWVYALSLLLPLTRPEGIVFACAGVFLFWGFGGNVARRFSYFAGALSFAVCYFLTRWHYFHNLFPNPYYVKLSSNSWRSLLVHIGMNLDQYKSYFLTLVLVLLLAQKITTRIFSLCALMLLLAVFAPHQLAMNYSDRFYFQLVFPILLLFLITEDVIRISRIATIICVFSLIGVNGSDLHRNLRYFSDLKSANIDLGYRLAPFAQGHTLMTEEAGTIPYFSNWVTYDPLGIGSGNFARQDLTYNKLEQLHPDIIFLYNSRPDTVVLDGSSDHIETLGPPDSVLIDYVRRSGKYHFAGASKWPFAHYLIAFVRDDIPQHDQIFAAIQVHARTSTMANYSAKDLLLQHYVPWYD